MIKLNINMAYCDFLKEEPGSENNRTDRKLFMRPFSMVKKKDFSWESSLHQQSFAANVKVAANQSLETACHKKEENQAVTMIAANDVHSV